MMTFRGAEELKTMCTPAFGFTCVLGNWVELMLMRAIDVQALRRMAAPPRAFSRLIV